MKRNRLLLLNVFAVFALVLLNVAATAQKKGKAINVLIVGGNSSHDFERWWGEEDKKTLEKDGLASVTYTEETNALIPLLAKADVLFLSNNKPIEDAATRKAIFDFVNAGHGLLLGHAATWYNWSDWPEYNAQLVGGGTSGHDGYASFTVKIVQDHPVTKNVQSMFASAPDELYHYVPDNSGANIIVLATSSSAAEPEKSYPSVFVVKHPKARIVACTLGHDGAAHQSQEYQTILVNALKWVAKKK